MYTYCSTVFNEFGNDYKIYIEDVKQGMTIPCFFITSELETKSIHLGKVRKNKIDFIVMYYNSNSEESNALDNGEVFYRLSECLEILDVDDIKVRTYNHKKSISDKILKFTFSIDLFYKKIVQTELMNKLDIEEVFSE